MVIGLCGAHRTGKTTLARAVSRKSGIPFASTTSSLVFKELGIDPAEPMTFRMRLSVQWRLLDSAMKVWQTTAPFITDRTPLDLMAYTLADIQTGCEASYTELCEYVSQCYELTNRTFSLLVLVQPGIALIGAPGKAALHPGYLEHLNTLIVGLLCDQRLVTNHICIGREVTDLDQRIRLVVEAIKESCSQGMEH